MMPLCHVYDLYFQLNNWFKRYQEFTLYETPYDAGFNSGNQPKNYYRKEISV